MFIPQDYMTKYPKCTTLIKNLDGTLKRRPKVLNAFLETCMAEEQLRSTPRQVEAIARKALRWATPPKIVVAEGMVKGIVEGESFEGCGWNNSFETAFGRKPFIMITSIWFDAVEFGTSVDLDKNADRLTRTVLHEVVHWVRGEAGASDDALDGPLSRGGRSIEAGRLFEERAFGIASLCTKDELWDAMLSRRD